ncbi:MAG: sugar phosphate isomerase/epimerase family protein [Gemmobacter sp.]|nr:sugar phosphate isomerase/epimerase family protein [Gemmobacter sp.]
MSLPVIGAALGTAGLETWRDWILDKQRDVELQAFHTSSVLNGDWTAEAAHTRKLLDGHTGHVGIHGPFWGFTIGTSDADVQRVVATRMAQGLDVCAAVGATQMVIHSPITTWDYNNISRFPGDWQTMVECVHACIGAAVSRAEDQGVTLVMENIEDIDPRHRRDLVESFNSPALTLSIDTGHAHYAHGSTGAPPLDYYVTSAGDLLDHVHLQDADGYADRHWAIGEGTILWPAVFRALSTLKAKPRLILELRDKAGIAGSMAYLERMGLGQ